MSKILYDCLIKAGHVTAIIGSTTRACPVGHARKMTLRASRKWGRFYRIM